jgi:uncharacterized protein (TIGR02099 family)
MKLRGRGPSQVDLDLLLPVRHMDDHRVNVLARIDDGDVSLAGTPHTLDRVQGSLRIQNRTVSSDAGLSATYLGGPARIELATETKGTRVDNLVRVRAQTPAPALAKALALPDFVKAGGVVDWRGVARIPADDNTEQRAPMVRVDTTLRGTSIGLPAPFAKAAADSRPLRLDAEWPSAPETVLRASYGGIMRTALRFERGGDSQWQFARGVLRFGDGDLRMPAGSGLEIRGSLDALDLSEWLAFSGGGRTAGVGRGLSSVLRSTDLAVRDFQIFGFHFPNLNATMLAGDRAWSVSADSPRARGTVLVPYAFDSETLVLNFSRLTLGDADDLQPEAGTQAPTAAADEPDPRNWPSVHASVNQFEAWGKKLGFLRAELTRTPEGLRLESFSAQAPSFTAAGTGSWLVGADGARGALKFEVASTDVLTTLQDLGYGASLTGKRGTLDADLTWPGAPSSTLAARLSGTVKLEMADGRLVNVAPGAGRVFGLMSVAALPRRLSLDFSDLLSKGLSYDSIRGDFRLEHGDAYTDNLVLRGPSAEIGIIGRTGLDTRDYDQTAVVTGSIGNSLPLVGALAGGPVVGAGLLLFSQIFKQPLKGIARGYYRITGPWDNPNVQRVEGAEARKAEGDTKTAEQARDAG